MERRGVRRIVQHLLTYSHLQSHCVYVVRRWKYLDGDGDGDVRGDVDVGLLLLKFFAN